MADLSFSEKRKLEELLGMKSGYVLNFTNRDFREFVFDSVGIDIYDEKYNYYSGSKANRLRAFWKKEPNHVAGKLIKDLINYNKDNTQTPPMQHEKCDKIAKRLLHDSPVREIDAIISVSKEKDFEFVSRSVREAIKKDEPEAGLDRLHTFVVKYIREIGKKHGIEITRDKPLHSMFGEYVKKLKKNNHLESEMTERILKSSISMLEAFNRVRNEQSLAHANPILNYDESLLIFKHVTATIRFLIELEKKLNNAD
jgi:hypothetical protein